MTESNLPALPDEEDYFDTGLNDLEVSRRIPRLKIVHRKGVFLDLDTNEEFPVLEGIPLGLVRQRVMWNREVEEGDKPLCKSNDGKIGYPNVEGPTRCDFPWKGAGIQQASAELDEFGRPTLSCEACPFSQWGPPAHGSKKGTPPACNERYTIPLLYSVQPGGAPDRAGVLSFQRSGITPMKTYMSVFKTQRKPLFAAKMHLALRIQSRGSVDYSVPYVRQLGPTDPGDWPQFADEFRRIREILQAPPAPPREEGDAESAQQPPAQQPPVQAQATVKPAAQGDPWATTTQAQSWPPTQPPQQVVPAASMPATATTVVDDDDLPF